MDGREEAHQGPSLNDFQDRRGVPDLPHFVDKHSCYIACNADKSRNSFRISYKDGSLELFMLRVFVEQKPFRIWEREAQDFEDFIINVNKRRFLNLLGSKRVLRQ